MSAKVFERCSPVFVKFEGGGMNLVELEDGCGMSDRWNVFSPKKVGNFLFFKMIRYSGFLNVLLKLRPETWGDYPI